MKTALAGGLVGGAFFLTLFGAAILRPGNTGWLMRHDSQTYYLAFAHFRHEAWQWPPGVISGVGYPVGTSIGNADAVPLVSFALKPLDRWLPEPFQFLGAWLLACYVLQGVFGALLVRQVSADVVAQVCGAALFVMAPALLHRTGHAALCAHWTLLAALWLLVAHRDLPRRQRVGGWVLLGAATAAIQPYLAVVVAGLGFGAIANAGFNRRQPGPLRRVMAEAGALAAAVLAVFWICGFFTIGATNLGREGLGWYSMNLLSPVNPLHYGRLLPALPMTSSDQAEGFVYFGAGWLALVLLALVVRLRGGSRPPSLGLAWISVAAFTLLAVSPVVTVADVTVADLNRWTPPQLAAFRSSGRFGWLPMYLAFVAVLHVLAAGVSRRVLVVALVSAVGLQAVDLSPGYAGLYTRERAAWWTDYDNPLKSPAWDLALAAHRHLVMAPPDMCELVWPAPVAPHLPFSMLAARHGATINSGNAGRYDAGAVARYCAAEEATIRAGRLDDNSLYVVSPAMRQALERAVTGVAAVCGPLDGVTVCATSASYARWAAAARAAGFHAEPLAR